MRNELYRKRLSNREEYKLGAAVAIDLGRTPNSDKKKFLNGTWKPLYVIANAADYSTSARSLLPSDAQVVHISTAAMLKYLAQLE